MIDNTKKYLQQREDDPPHLGNFVKWFIIQQRTPKNVVSKNLGITPNNLSRYFYQSSLQFGILWRISKVINYNMIMDLGQRLDIPFETEAEKKLKVQLAAQDARIEKLEIQLAVLREAKK